ncbi:hypothetical protein B0H11DRAFT_2218087 [Mycena galericulata]|nr:hypothetical protein B0H11DRAFT_2218087 [Mycena galericulata]
MAATPIERKYDFKTHLILPHAVVEYKKYSDDEGNTLNQGRMYLVSLVAFYSALGIEDYPFFSKFDISSPIQAFHFATFLLRLRDDQEKLKKRVEAKLRVGVDATAVREWRKLSQIGEDDEDSETDAPSD